MEQLKSVLDGIIRPLVYDAIESYFENNPIPGQTAHREQDSDFLSLKEAAKFLQVAEQTIYQNIKRIPHSKRFGKLFFRRSELVKYLEEGAQQSKKGGKQ